MHHSQKETPLTAFFNDAHARMLRGRAMLAVFAAKKQLRQELKRALAAMTKQQRQDESAILTSKVSSNQEELAFSLLLLHLRCWRVRSTGAARSCPSTSPCPLRSTHTTYWRYPL